MPFHLAPPPPAAPDEPTPESTGKRTFEEVVAGLLARLRAMLDALGAGGRS